MPRVKSSANSGWARQAALRDGDRGGLGNSGAGPSSVSKVPEPHVNTVRFEDQVFDKYQEIYASWQKAPSGDQPADPTSDAMERVRDQLMSSQTGASVCLICLETIKPNDPTWHCRASCYNILHLQCAQSWAQQQVSASRARFEERRRLYPTNHPEHVADLPPICFACPKCRYEYSPDEIPREYLCFCGKVTDPEFDPWNAPHSCGEICGRRLESGCEHTCVLLCHPGPCPPCPREVVATCFCGKQESRMRCGFPGYSCRMTCRKSLPCGHKCEQECHEGPCPPCSIEADHKCFCSAETRRLPCSMRLWACERACKKQLSCGRHTCTLGCHAGLCPPCPREGDRVCPCGKATFKGLECHKETPLCGETCSKLLSCGVHTCTERCHRGPCPETCREMVLKTCSCGKMQKKVPCHQEVRCERRCQKQRACGRHACKRRCCDGNCPPCPETCGRKLPCGNHRCQSPCHAGSCLPCPLTVTISCACGASRFSFPCGSEKRAEPPKCTRPCAIPYICRHKNKREPHPCHYGPCPPCPFRCLAIHPSCGHICDSKSCHDLPPPAVAEYSPPPPPAPYYEQQSANSQRLERPVVPVMAALAKLTPEVVSGAETACKVCTKPVEVMCLGGHETCPRPCYSAKPYACKELCGRPLPCGNHTCRRECHDFNADPCQACERQCERQRPCGHPCPKRCHNGPCDPCIVQEERVCHCGKTRLEFKCHELFDLTKDQRSAKLCCGKTCHKQLAHCPHACSRPCHPGPCEEAGAQCQDLVTVRCLCKRLKEKWPCSRVQEAVRARTGSPSYTESSSLRLLECGSQCQQQPQGLAQDLSGKLSHAERQRQEAEPPVGLLRVEQAASAETELHRMTKEEKRRQREARQLARIAAQEEADARKARDKKFQLLIKVVAVVMLLLAGIGVGLVLFEVAAPEEL